MMQFKYKITKSESVCVNYNIIIKKRLHLFGNVYVWFKWDELSLRSMLRRLNPEIFADVNQTWELSIDDFYNGLKQYSSIKELVMKYIINSINNTSNYMNADKLLDEFVLENGQGWTIIEVKESKE